MVSGFAHIGDRLLFESLTLPVRSGEWTALLGPSGSGKSTLLRLIAGLPVAAEFDGNIEADDQHNLSDRIGYMAQQDLLLEWATVRDNISLGRRLRGEDCPPGKLSKIIGAVGLNDKAEKRPCELSGGQRQRVALARTLLEDRPVILLDEPFSALGPSLKDQMLDLIKKISKNKKLLVLMATHEPADAKKVASQTLVVKDKKVHPPVSTEKALDPINGPLADYLLNQ